MLTTSGRILLAQRRLTDVKNGNVEQFGAKPKRRFYQWVHMLSEDEELPDYIKEYMLCIYRLCIREVSKKGDTDWVTIDDENHPMHGQKVKKNFQRIPHALLVRAVELKPQIDEYLAANPKVRE